MQGKKKKKRIIMVMVPSEIHDSETFYTKLTECLDSSGLSLIFNVRETLLDLYLFYLEVTKRGGYHQVGQEKKWGEVVSALKLEGSDAKLCAQVEMLYEDLLYEFEQLYFHRCPVKQASSSAPCSNVEPETKKRRGAPKGQRNAYHLFLKQECARLRACTEASLDRTRILRTAIDAWKNLSEIDKQPYVEESKKNKEKCKEEQNQAMIIYNKGKNIVQDMKKENKPSEYCGDYFVSSQPEITEDYSSSVVSAELGLALEMTRKVMSGELPNECLQEWDTYFSVQDLLSGPGEESK